MIGVAQPLISVLAGALTTLSPCVFPILPLVIGGATQRHKLAPISMALGLITSFALLGVLVGVLGDLIGLDVDIIRLIGAWLILSLGVFLFLPAASNKFAHLLSPISNMANSLGARFGTDSLWGSFALGCLLGMVWSPCSGPLLASTIALVATDGGALKGALLLGLFGMGASVPLVAISYASRSKINKSRDFLMQHANTIKKVFGVLLVFMGISILMGWDKQLEAYFVQFMPAAWVNLTTQF